MLMSMTIYGLSWLCHLNYYGQKDHLLTSVTCYYYYALVRGRPRTPIPGE